MAAGGDVFAAQVLDERIVTFVLRHDVKTTARIGQHRATQVISQGEIERVPARRCEADQFHGSGVLHELFHHRGIELRLFGTQQQSDVDSLAADDGEIKGVDVLVVHEDMVHGRREVVGFFEHKISRWRLPLTLKL